MERGRMLDCVIIGGGPAGLTAAIYLARYRRSFCIVDAGQSRGTVPRSDLARQADARLSANGCAVVDSHQMTSVDGLYAAGDVIEDSIRSPFPSDRRPLRMAIHNRLERNWL